MYYAPHSVGTCGCFLYYILDLQLPPFANPGIRKHSITYPCKYRWLKPSNYLPLQIQAFKDRIKIVSCT